MTTIERMYALYEAVTHIERLGLDGDVVECGVWRGGSSMLAARRAAALTARPSATMWLYDTFEGMSEPTEHDVAQAGETVSEGRGLLPRAARPSEVLAYAGLSSRSRPTWPRRGTRPPQVRYVAGKVEDTIPPK